MTPITLYCLLFGGVGLLFIALSVPLIQERVPPNSTYICVKLMDSSVARSLVDNSLPFKTV